MSADTPQLNPNTLPPGTVVGGSWRLLERLGAGGFGVVYKVEALNAPGRYFALKLSHHPHEPRSKRELILLMDKAVHPHVVAVHAWGRWPDIITGHFFFVMDWVPGPAFHLWADLHNPSFQQLADAARRVSLILDALHAMGVLHRDLKPEHLLMRGPQGDPVLIDLGSGDYPGAPTLTTGPLPPGTLHLRSPESVRFHQRHWRRLDVRYAFEPTDDLYALGVCFYRAATGHYPFSPEWPPDVLCAAIASQQPPAPSAVNPRVPPALDGVILRLLEKDPEQRFQTGAQLHQALVTALKQHPGEAWETPVFEWHDAPHADGEGTSARGHRTRRPEWPTHTHRPPSVARAKLLRLWAELLGVLRPPPRPTPHASPGKAVLEGRARRVHPHRRQRALLATVGLVLVTGLAGLGVRASGAWRHTTAQVRHEATTSVGHKLASLTELPDTALAAVPPEARPTPAAATLPVAPPQKATPVKKTDLAPRPQTSEEKPQTPRARSVGNLVRTAAAAACTGLACASSPPVSQPPLPPAEECFDFEIATMRKLGIGGGDTILVELLKDGQAVPMTIREGPATVYPVEDVGEIGPGAQLDGYIYIGSKRIYGRFKTLHLNGMRYPVCFELYDDDTNLRGSPREEGGDDRTAMVYSRVEIQSVHHFDRFE